MGGEESLKVVELKKENGHLGDAETGNQRWPGLGVWEEAWKITMTLAYFTLFYRIDFLSSTRGLKK